MTALGDLDRARIGELHAREVTRFQDARPRSLAMVARARAHMPNGMPMAWMAYHDEQPVYIDHGQGAGFTDIDGFSYLDFNASDMSMFCGHANPAIVASVQARAARSTQFLLPTEESVEVAEELAHGTRCRCGSSRCRPPRPTPRPSGWRGPSPGARWSCCSRGTTTAISRRAWS